MPQPSVAIIAESRVRRSLPLGRTIELARDAMVATADGSALDSSLAHLAAPEGEFHLKASGLRIEGRLYVCVKIGACFYGRPARWGLPSIVGLIQLFDGDTGQPLAVMESARITALRTAAASAVAVDVLAGASARSLAVCGAGEQAVHHVRAIAAVRELDRVTVWSRRPDRAEATVRALAPELPGIAFDVGVDVAATVAGADVVATLTPATTPYVAAGAVARGALVVAVGSDAPEKNELAPQLLAASRVVCDVVDQCVRVGELHHAVAAGLVRAGDAVELGEVLTGSRTGRTGPEEIVVYDSTGTAVQDTAAAVAVYQDALDDADTLEVNLWDG